MVENELSYNANGEAVGFSGPDAVKFYQAASLAGFLKLYAKSGIIPTRGVTGAKMLVMATGFTGKKYKRGAYLQAAEDVLTWAREMKAALPTRTIGE